MSNQINLQGEVERLTRQGFIINRLPKLIQDWENDSKKYPADVRAAYLFCAARLKLLLDGQAL